MDSEKFKSLLSGFGLAPDVKVAVAVSGGPDSMALGFMLARFTDFKVHVLSVDHGLRADAAAEVSMVEAAARSWGAEFQSFKWEHAGVESRLHEAARRARYEMMAGYCAEQGISDLFTAHHMDDQAETFLIRLAAGSGLDGLAGMRAVSQVCGVRLLRPLLGVEKAELVAFCEGQGIEYVRDPSNEDGAYARGRLRAGREVLEAEGLTPKRLSVTAGRMARARAALDEMAGRLYDEAVQHTNPARIVFDCGMIKDAPEEIGLRCALKALAHFRPAEDYAPRFEKVEALFMDLMAEAPFRKRTLGGVIFERDDAAGVIILTAEML